MPNIEERKLFHRHLKKYFILCYVIFIVSFVLFLIIGRYSTSAVRTAYSIMESVIESSGINTQNLLISTMMLFFNNLRVAALCMCVGFLPFLFLPAVILVINAGVSGLVISYAAATTHISAGTLILRGILPHGIFEITAIVFASALGLVLCEQLMLMIQRKPLMMPFARTIAYAFLLFVIIAVPLLISAAVVENCITPLLVSNLH